MTYAGRLTDNQSNPYIFTDIFRTIKHCITMASSRNMKRQLFHRNEARFLLSVLVQVIFIVHLASSETGKYYNVYVEVHGIVR